MRFFHMNEFNKQRKNLHLIKLSLYERRKQTFKKVIKKCQLLHLI